MQWPWIPGISLAGLQWQEEQVFPPKALIKSCDGICQGAA